MRVYKVELMILDFDEIGGEEIRDVIENQRYPNHCISPNVMHIESRELGEWDDEHPLNNTKKMQGEFYRLFEAA